MPHIPFRIVLSAVLCTALVFAASQSFAASFRVMNDSGQTIAARCSGGTWSEIEHRDGDDFDCSGDSIEVAADTDGTDSVTVTWNCDGNNSTSSGGETSQQVQRVQVTKDTKGNAEFEIAQETASSCFPQAVDDSSDQ